MPSTHRSTRTLGVLAALASGAVLVTGTTAPATGTPRSGATVSRPSASTAPAAPRRAPRDVELVQTRTSLLGQHKWYRQVKNGHFVVGGWYATHWNKFTERLTIWDGRRKHMKLSATQPQISLARAKAVATNDAKTTLSSVTATGLWVLPPTTATATARLVYAISTADGRGARTSYVDAVNGAVLLTRVDAHKVARHRTSVTGVGRVFDPNPVVKLQDETLTDQHDSATAVPATGYVRVPLPRLNGSHELAGRYVRIVNKNRAHSTTNTYLFNRANDFFEQTSAYYDVDAEQQFLQSLGFTDVNSAVQPVMTDAFADDNSYYEPGIDQIELGTGGVDDAEDPEVIWHEYGHAIQDDQVIDFGWSHQAASMGEGFGDYMAVTMSQQTAPVGTRVTPTPCVMDWDATSYTTGPTHCLRRTDTNRVFPSGLDPDPHTAGLIWSRALWDMNKSMGRLNATKLIIEAQFWMYPTVTMPRAAEIVVSTAAQLVKNGLLPPGSVTKARAALLARHLLSS
jgi:Zn-dependent metalloprotease